MAKKKSDSGKNRSDAEGGARPYVVLARKYRPQSFDDLIGQEAMVKTLRNAFASGRIAQAYMLTGVRGVGKTTTARIIARALNYETETVKAPTFDMPELGRHCAEIMESRHPDVIEMDAASNTGVDNIRELIESARYKPIIARTKVFIIDEVHMLSKGAFNALLKTLEEPPEHVKFIFATTEIRKVPVTVLSRTQRFDLRRVDVPELAAHFANIVAKEGAKAEDDALALIARAAEGSVRDGLSLLDQAIAMGEGDVRVGTVRSMLGLADRGRIFDLLEHAFRGDAKAALTSLDELHRDGAEPVQLLGDLAEAVHAAARVKAVGVEAGSEGLSAEERRRAASIAAKLSTPLLSRAWQMLLKGGEETAKAANPRAAAEMVLIRLAYTADLPAPDEVIRLLGGEGALARSGKPVPADNGGTRDAPLNQDSPAPPVAASAPLATYSTPPSDELPFVDDENPGLDLEYDATFDDAALDDAAAAPTARADPRSFDEVIALTGARRDMMLKVHLEDRVSLVKFDAAAGSIDLYLLPGAPPQIANELREKLNAWTQRKWVVVLSKAAGERPRGEVRREREAAELEALKTHPAVKAVLDQFPDAKIAEIRPLLGPGRDETGTG
ncbi:MAG: DNA polymerase III subunit gamma/tau [Hyphomicrobium sp.]|uniref:DNA polymerase III subunit gamma/tau n=1 Tax=Hyphomicrobium sp. TaxID=82 RepID=UPI00132304D2|nr:DNA polymerase III subunit gamma/tau [Hyphomicrobium sp.]KAB2941769.1 MAG: DNA polymerase III subunit gamma/tau [Hyphomicrobium sp.]MBZ0210305.1 DNA polymerase III subunit gamma/tau [Hyphomicrobium sp.]